MNPHGIRPTEVDPTALATYNAGVLFSRLAYENAKPKSHRQKAAEAQARYRAKKAMA